ILPAATHGLGGAAVHVLVREAFRQLAAAVGHRDAEDLHSAGPHVTNTGFSAARRKLPSGRRAPRETATCTRWPRRSPPAAARSRATRPLPAPISHSTPVIGRASLASTTARTSAFVIMPAR